MGDGGRHDMMCRNLLERLRCKGYSRLECFVEYHNADCRLTGELDVYAIRDTPQGRFFHYYEVKSGQEHGALMQLARWKRYMTEQGIPYTHLRGILVTSRGVRRA